MTRAQWRARPPAEALAALSRPAGVTIHWNGPGVGVVPHTRCPGMVAGIQRYHQDVKGWDDIAYTALVCQHGVVFEGRGVGYRTAANGTRAGNATHYAVCALTGEGDPLTPALLAGLDDAIVWLRTSGAGPDVNGHRDHKPTRCPGDDLYAWAHQPHPTSTTQEDDMPSLPEIATAVWSAGVGRGTRVRTLSSVLVSAETHAKAADAKADLILDVLSQVGEVDSDALAAKVAAAVARLDAEQVADQLTITTKETP